jgi:hypothetical protein
VTRADKRSNPASAGVLHPSAEPPAHVRWDLGGTPDQRGLVRSPSDVWLLSGRAVHGLTPHLHLRRRLGVGQRWFIRHDHVLRSPPRSDQALKNRQRASTWDSSLVSSSRSLTLAKI